MAHRRPPPTILDAEAAERLAEMHDFEELDAIDEDYDKLVVAITTIRDSCRKRKPNHITSRITEETRQLLQKRRKLKRTTHSHLEMTSLNGLCRERVARDHEEFTRKRLMTAAESRTRIKLAARNIAEYRHVIPCSKDSEGKKITSRLGTEAVIKEYYERLFRSSMATAPGRMLTPLLENTLPFTPSEVRHAVESMPSGKCSGEDKLVVEDACREHQVPLVMTFIDYCKAFDSMKHHTVWESLLEQGVEQKYVDVLKDCYSNCTTTFRPFIRPIVVPIKEDVRQGDPISPNLFSAVLESVIRKSDWDEYGVNVNGRMLKHLRFADDIVLLTHRPQEAEQMVRQLNEEDRKVGLQLNAKKTKAYKPVCLMVVGGIGVFSAPRRTS
ncbi:reverse transcriptase [Ancylostoma duodenale]|uniref:Reverse transcriptase n=1 Tax=Ancylostoma duodenale TaxID=51022 RepID=A0A0C2GP28_9BILA|nr:reverse transcriptase [Ancylostoma duodenale]